MKRQTVDVFHALMKKGWIDRSEDPDVWQAYDDPLVMEELEMMQDGLDFELVRSTDRIYMVPTQSNDLFLKNNIDFRKDIKADNEVRRRDLYLMNYFSVYLLYLFYHGEGNDPRCREFILKEDLIDSFSKHCAGCIKGAEADHTQTDYSESFLQLANAWLSMVDGSPDSRRFNERYGLLNRLLIKFGKERDDLFYVEGMTVRPTRKLDDLMPYFLRKDRIAEIQNWLGKTGEGGAYAADHEG